MNKITIDQIDALLPQTQCGECHYAGCRPYAEAIAADTDSINHCPPGGVATLQALAKLLQISAEPYFAEVHENTRAPKTAIIREAECIGCTKCIQACPVDAIMGSAKHMHSILQNECTGCGLCVEPCPVDCIDLIELQKENYHRDVARQRHQFRQFRLERDKQERATKHQHAVTLKAKENQFAERQAKQDYIAAAIQRVKNKRK